MLEESNSDRLGAMEFLVILRGLARLGFLLGLIGFWLSSFRLLLREPLAWQYSFFRILGWLGIFTIMLEVLIRGSALTWLHLTYGVLAVLLVYCVAGLYPNGWFRNALAKQPENVGPYYFWASFIGILLWLRFTTTG